MAGSERSGFSNSSDHLLENAYYIITPGGEVALEKISDFTELISSLGAIPLVITAEEHDFITAGVSHLPHIVASALVNLVNLLDNDAQYMKMIAAGGFRDITRIASSSPVMWEQICLENQKNISTVLDEFIRMLIQIRCSIDNKEADNIFDMFASSKDYRDSIDIVDNSLIPAPMSFISMWQMRPVPLQPSQPSLQPKRSASKISVLSTIENLKMAF